MPHQFGGREFRAGRRELGHLHGRTGSLDLPFPVRIRERLVRGGASGTTPHPARDRMGIVSHQAVVRCDTCHRTAPFELLLSLQESDAKDEVDEASEESFPASDPPAFVSSTGSHPLPPARRAS